MGHSADMEEISTRATFIRGLRKVLLNLYNPGLVRHSPVIQLFGLAQRRDAPSALQHLLTEAIESLEPGEDCPVGSNAWRIYQVLRGRYIDQFSQEEVAHDLFLSPRQLRRLEQNAVEVLADHLWAAYNLELRVNLLIEPEADESGRFDNAGEEALPESGPSGRNEELSWLERTLSNQVCDGTNLIYSALQTARPLIESLHTQVQFTPGDNLPQLSIHPTTIRQALLHLITQAARYAGSGQIVIQAASLPDLLYVRLRITAHPAGSPVESEPTDIEGIEVARKLIQLSKGALEIVHATISKFDVIITLPTAEQVPVLVIDDNLDTLQLVERYLSGTRFRFIGAANPGDALAMTERISPSIILLDVMLPDMDGWDLLGRLRAHPKTYQTPVIVCTILPQAQLALMLGAAEFLSKPIRREALLSVLDRLVGPASPKSA